MKTPRKKKAGGEATPTASVKHFGKHDTSTPNQRSIVLAALQTGPKTTIELQYEYGVMAPSVRISELKKKGHNIEKVKVVAQTPDGVWHKGIAKYFLVPGEGA